MNYAEWHEGVKQEVKARTDTWINLDLYDSDLPEMYDEGFSPARAAVEILKGRGL